MKLSEIEAYRQELHNISNMETENQRRQELVKLAKKVGAGYALLVLAALWLGIPLQ